MIGNSLGGMRSQSWNRTRDQVRESIRIRRIYHLVKVGGDPVEGSWRHLISQRTLHCHYHHLLSMGYYTRLNRHSRTRLDLDYRSEMG